MAHITLRKGPFRTLKWPISQLNRTNPPLTTARNGHSEAQKPHCAELERRKRNVKCGIV